MKIIVTGGAGFIGSHIVDACLRAGHDIEIIDNLSTGSSENIPRDITVHRIDIRDVLAVAEIFKTFQPVKP